MKYTCKGCGGNWKKVKIGPDNDLIRWGHMQNRQAKQCIFYRGLEKQLIPGKHYSLSRVIKII